MVDEERPGAFLDLAVDRRRALGRLGVGIASAAGLATLTNAANAQEATPQSAVDVPPDFKVVFHAAQEQHWPYILSNLTNLREFWPESQLRVVVDGSAVYTLQGSNKLTEELDKAAEAGMQLVVCPNALREHKIDPATIPSYADVSLGGVAALVQAHNQGFVYVKP